ncbi:hypothetical protein [Arthrobacter sp. OAP107]|uniref:hypothetical protein n=1 Tax=Arthrobacter sp. OAP107 TaxID=3156445 RepID=UPI00339419EE
MAKAVTFSMTAVPKNGAQDSFRNTVLSLELADLKDCILSVFHISDSYALLTGEALPAAHTTTTRTPRVPSPRARRKRLRLGPLRKDRPAL